MKLSKVCLMAMLALLGSHLPAVATTYYKTKEEAQKSNVQVLSEKEMNASTGQSLKIPDPDKPGTFKIVKLRKFDKGWVKIGEIKGLKE